MIRVLVPVADGSEEMEAVITVDVLRRAGWHVTLAGMKPGLVTASRGVRIQPDAAWDEVDPATFDAIMIPGGKAAHDLARDERLLASVRAHHRAGKWIGAICAAPLVLQAAGILDGVRATCHPSVTDQLTRAKHAPERVIVSGRIITSQGPATTFDFALALVRAIDGDAAARTIAAGMVLDRHA